MASPECSQDAAGESVQMINLKNIRIDIVEKLKYPSSDPMGIQQVDENERKGDESELGMPLEIWLQILDNADPNDVIAFSQTQRSALLAVVSYLELKLKSKKLVYGPDCPHNVFTIAVAAFPPESFGIDLDLEATRHAQPVTPTKLKPAWLEELDPKMTPVYRYLVRIINKILIAQNVCKYVEDVATNPANRWQMPHRPYFSLPNPKVEEVPKRIIERSLVGMMMLWHCLIDVKQTIEERTQQRRQYVTEDLLKYAVRSFVKKVVPGIDETDPENDKAASKTSKDQRALITVFRGLYFIEPLIEVIRIKVEEQPALQNVFDHYGNEGAWASMLIYHGLDKFLEILTEPGQLDAAVQGDLPWICPPSQEDRVDNWSRFIGDVLRSGIFDDIKHEGFAALRAPNNFY